MSEEEPRTGCGGILVLTVFSAFVGAAIYAYSRDLLVICIWAAGATLLWRANKRVPHAANPAPPPASERSPETDPQVKMVRDTSHPNRWVATRPSEWLDWTDDNDRDET